MGSEATTSKEVSKSVLDSQINAEASRPSTGGNIPERKREVNNGQTYPGVKRDQNQTEFDAKEDIGAARRAINKQVPNTARPALSKKEYDASKYDEHQ